MIIVGWSSSLSQIVRRMDEDGSRMAKSESRRDKELTKAFEKWGVLIASSQVLLAHQFSRESARSSEFIKSIAYDVILIIMLGLINYWYLRLYRRLRPPKEPVDRGPGLSSPPTTVDGDRGAMT